MPTEEDRLAELLLISKQSLQLSRDQNREVIELDRRFSVVEEQIKKIVKGFEGNGRAPLLERIALLEIDLKRLQEGRKAMWVALGTLLAASIPGLVNLVVSRLK